jgi:hypothetical protein
MTSVKHRRAIWLHPCTISGVSWLPPHNIPGVLWLNTCNISSVLWWHPCNISRVSWQPPVTNQVPHDYLPVIYRVSCSSRIRVWHDSSIATALPLIIQKYITKAFDTSVSNRPIFMYRPVTTEYPSPQGISSDLYAEGPTFISWPGDRVS